MYGAIIGDIIGSRFEFGVDDIPKDFKLFYVGSRFTDDTVLTVAVADALLGCNDDSSDEEIKNRLKRSFGKYFAKYPNAGYGMTFTRWMSNGMSKPYYSYGNGSAMRVSSAGWLYDTLETTRRVARITAEISHNHPEGIKGAECVASVIWLLRNGYSREDVAHFVERIFGYDIPQGVDEIKQQTDVTCMSTIPVAVASFLYGDDFEDVIRNAVSIGGDTDTTAAIAGSMAEAYFDIPYSICKEGRRYLPDDMMNVVLKFYDTYKEREKLHEAKNRVDG